jgi:endogenous inhibitor of DNA gyrase (YacG/DUF329 family)
MDRKDMFQMRLNGHSYQQIGEKAGVSRQRIQQILSPPSGVRELIVGKYHGLCQDCGIYVGNSGHIHHIGNNGENYNDIENLELLCVSCHRRKHKDPSKERCCISCGKPVEHHNLYCKECFHKAHYVTLTCAVCGKSFEREKSQYNPKKKRILKEYFCSKVCYGVWLGRNHGFGVNTQNRRKGM